MTSRGTGIRGNCGGLDNPTHYVRIKLFLKWIKVTGTFISANVFHMRLPFGANQSTVSCVATLVFIPLYAQSSIIAANRMDPF